MVDWRVPSASESWREKRGNRGWRDLGARVAGLCDRRKEGVPTEPPIGKKEEAAVGEGVVAVAVVVEEDERERRCSRCCRAQRIAAKLLALLPLCSFSAQPLSFYVTPLFAV
ncbi:hypothetical protein PIB30_035528 [Stylosanthes scabra]|uniref:Uncharacterized protein n=1 Tax=Stylosanthes scabra TaxID=79078 RepID=A0ABU6QEH4_9FABA|nr:hypothetical protein [Stylosanthes scabra]